MDYQEFDEFVWATLGLLVAARLLRPKNPQMRFLFCLTVTIVTAIVWGTRPGFMTASLFSLVVLPVLAALYSRQTWRKTLLIFAMFHLTFLATIFTGSDSLLKRWDSILFNLGFSFAAMVYSMVIVWLLRFWRRQVTLWVKARKQENL